MADIQAAVNMGNCQTKPNDVTNGKNDVTTTPDVNGVKCTREDVSYDVKTPEVIQTRSESRKKESASYTEATRTDGDVVADDVIKEKRLLENMTDKLLKSWISEATEEIHARQQPSLTPEKPFSISISHFDECDDVTKHDDVIDTDSYDPEELRRRELLADEIDEMDYDLDDDTRTTTHDNHNDVIETRHDVIKTKSDVGASGDVYRDVDIGDVTAAAMPDPSEVMAMLQRGVEGAGAAGVEGDPEETLNDEEYYYSDDSDFNSPAVDFRKSTQNNEPQTSGDTEPNQQPQQLLPEITSKIQEETESKSSEQTTADNSPRSDAIKPVTTTLAELEACNLNLNLVRKPGADNLQVTETYDYLQSSKSNRTIGHYNELLKLQMDVGRLQRCMSEMQSQIRTLARAVENMTEQAEADLGQ